MSDGSDPAPATAAGVLAGVDLTGRRALVTGATSGIGRETARVLAAAGADVVLAVRDRTVGEAVAAGLAAAPGAGGVTVVDLDLADLTSVDRCVSAVVDRVDRLDLVVADAGIMATPFARTVDGVESQLGTNHLGHAALVLGLVPLLRASAPSRVVVLSSAGHRSGGVDPDDPWGEAVPYDPWTAYGRSKTANVLFAVALDRRLAGDGVRAVAVHPGTVRTALGRHLTPETVAALRDRAAGRTLRFVDVDEGAATTVWAGVVAAADEVGGRYCESCAVAPVVDDPSAEGVMDYAVDPARADLLWDATLDLLARLGHPVDGPTA